MSHFSVFLSGIGVGVVLITIYFSLNFEKRSDVLLLECEQLKLELERQIQRYKNAVEEIDKILKKSSS